MLIALGLLAASVMPATSNEVRYVVPLRGPITRHFEAPPDPYGPGHRGIDIAVPAGTTVVAPADGIVTFAGPVAGSLFVTVEHSDGIRTTSSYLSAVLVRRGDRVAQRAAVGRSGAGHPASGMPPHLHFGARRGDVYIDPEPLLVAALRRDYAALVRLAAEPDGRVIAPLPWMLVAPARSIGGGRRRGGWRRTGPFARNPPARRRRRSSLRSGAAHSDPSGVCRESSAGR